MSSDTYSSSNIMLYCSKLAGHHQTKHMVRKNFLWSCQTVCIYDCETMHTATHDITIQQATCSNEHRVCPKPL